MRKLSQTKPVLAEAATVDATGKLGELTVLLFVAVLGSASCSSAETSPATRGSSTASSHSVAGSGTAGHGAAISSKPSTDTSAVLTTGAAMSKGASSAPGSMTDAPVSSMIDDCGASNPAGLNPEDTRRLMAGGPSAPRLLYPYAETVFPRGMLPPTLMWDGAQAQSVYVHIQSSLFEWKGCVRPTGANQLVLPENVWRSASASTQGAHDPFVIELTTLSGGTVAGPTKIAIVIAQATLKGSIYYNSYSSASSPSGSVFRIPAGGKAELFLGGGFGCYGCHTLSANGERMVAHSGADPGQTFELGTTTQANPPQLAAAPLAGFVGLTPSGKYYVPTAHPAGMVRPQGTPGDATLVNDATLFETDTGSTIDGSGIAAGAMMPSFSPGGTLVAFNDVNVSDGRALAVMDFDETAHTFMNQRVVFTDTDHYPGWPFFLPDSKAIVFARGVNPQFSGSGGAATPPMAPTVGGAPGMPGGLPGLPPPGPPGAPPGAAPGGPRPPGMGGLGSPESDLYAVDIATGTATILARAMGLSSATDSKGYVPFGADDLHKHYYPTVSPVSAGGYFWVFFDSVRNYGNLGLQRQLWGAAISIAPDGNYTTDRSHPAFYLPGQEFGTGNHRAFAALDACVKDGNSCETGIDCCGGFCSIPDNASKELGDPVGTCTSNVPTCAGRDERCVADADCCAPQPGQAANSCIAGFCAFIDLK